MDRLLSLACFVAALACGCLAVLLALSGFVEYLLAGRWPDQSLLQLGYHYGVIQAHWFLANEWIMPVRRVLAAVPAALALVVLVPLLWWLSGRLAA